MTIDEILNERFGYTDFRPGQREIIQSVLAGKDTFALLPTGMGKSLCYQIPAYVLQGTTVIISPLLSLMQDQVEQLKKFGEKRVAALNSSLSEEDKQYVWKHFEQFRFLFLSPEMLSTEAVKERLRSMELSLIVVDEAHCISQWGFDFRPEYLQIAEALPEQRPPILAMSATVTEQVMQDIETYLKMTNTHRICHSVDRANLHYEVKHLHATEKIKEIVEQVTTYEGPGILYTQSRKKAEMYAQMLEQQGVRVAFYHGGMEHHDRQLIQHQYIQDELDWICATNAFGMGVHKNNIRQIIHDYVPQNVASYMQEVGRAGRDGNPSVCTLYMDEEDVARTLDISLMDLPTKIQVNQFFDYAKNGQNPFQLVTQGMLSETSFRMLNYWMHHLSPEDVYTKVQQLSVLKRQQLSELVHILKGDCIRKGLLLYFGEQYEGNISQCCSSCGLRKDTILEKYVPHYNSKVTVTWQDRIAQILM